MGERRTFLTGASLGLTVLGYLALQAVAGVPGSPLVPPAPPGAGVPCWTRRLAGWVGFDRIGRIGLIVLAIGLLGSLVALATSVLAAAWLGRVGLRPVLIATTLSVGLAVAGPVVLSRDAYSYAAYGRIRSVHGANPYLTPPASFPEDPFVRVTSAEWLRTRSLYGPGFVLLSAGLTGAMRGSSGATVFAFKLVAGVAILGATLLVVGACRRRRARRAAFAAAAVGLNPVMVVHTVGGGHNDALIALLLAAAVAVWAGLGRRDTDGEPADPDLRRWRGRAVIVTVLLTLAALVKVIAGLGLVVWLWYLLRSARREDRIRIVGTHVGLALAVGAAFIAPFWAGLRTLAPLGTLAGVQGWASPARLVARGARGLGDALVGASVGSAASKAVVGSFLALFAVVLFMVLRRADPRRMPGGHHPPIGTEGAAAVPDHPSLSLAGAWGATFLAFALTAPYLVPWYVAWFVPFLGLMEDAMVVWAGSALTGVLALTGVPAEPAGRPDQFRAMLLGVHYVAAPIALFLLLVIARRLLRPGAERRSPPRWRKRGRMPAVPPDRARPARSA